MFLFRTEDRKCRGRRVWGLLWGLRIHVTTLRSMSEELKIIREPDENRVVAGFLSSVQQLGKITRNDFQDRPFQPLTHPSAAWFSRVYNSGGLRIYVRRYCCTIFTMSGLEIMAEKNGIVVERVQTGIRIEKRLLKVMKGLAEYLDLTLGDLVEGMVLHAFDGKSPFSEESLRRIKDLKKLYDLDLDSSASHRLTEVRLAKRVAHKGR